MDKDIQFHIAMTATLLLGESVLPAASVIQFSTNACPVNESDPAAVLRLERSGNLELAVSVDYATTNGTAQSQLDYFPSQGSLQFAPGESNKIIEVRLLDDRLAECSETFGVNLSNPSAGANLGAQAAATVTILRNDWGPLFVDPPEVTGATMKLSWSGGTDGWLEQTTNLASGAWQEVPGSQGQTNLTLPLAESLAFFRSAGPPPPIKLTVLADNYRYAMNTAIEWGFSCLIEGMERSILFDTGSTTSVLSNNLVSLGLNLCCVDLMVISHDHFDHVGGLPMVLAKNHDLDAYLPVSVSLGTRQIVEQSGATVRCEQSPAIICSNVWLTGEMPGQLRNEQSLILDTAQGLVIVTGCAHQGITNILVRAKEIMNKDIYLVLGGFHLLSMTEAQIREIIGEFRRQGVRKCGASHCTGDLAINLFREAYGQDYESLGTGKVIEIRAGINHASYPNPSSWSLSGGRAKPSSTPPPPLNRTGFIEPCGSPEENYEHPTGNEANKEAEKTSLFPWLPSVESASSRH